MTTGLDPGIFVRPRSRIEPEERRQSIIDAAEEVFLEAGFDAASMSTIAARVGGSKGTLYQYFRSKDELFEHYVRRRSAKMLEAIYASVPACATASEALTSFGQSHLRLIASRENLRHLRVVIAAAERHPNLGLLFYEAGPRHGARLLAERIGAWTAMGTLKVVNPLEAAQHFIELCSQRHILAGLCGQTRELSALEIEEQVASAVNFFLVGATGATSESLDR